ncbi:MAG: hypothetical protein AAB629_01645 [Patescibacteria group bacterium]
MKTVTAVVDGKLTDEQLGGLTRRTSEITRRLNEETLSYSWVMNKLQRVVEGKNIAKTDWEVWESLVIGKGKPDLSDLNISDTAQGILDGRNFPWTNEETKLDLVCFNHRGWEVLISNTHPSVLHRGELYQCAQEHGYRLCPAALIVPLYWMIADKYYKQWDAPSWEVVIGMEPVYAPVFGKSALLIVKKEFEKGLQISLILASIPGSIRSYTGNYWLFVNPPAPA